ncbi:MAG: hypothetical protein QGD93_10905 [Actinomycetota bacterium]|nr:hypothetical protein [Actinomycetota bacterium]
MNRNAVSEALAFHTPDAEFGDFMTWATAHAADELNRLMPGGLFRYDGEAAEDWLELLARYAVR